MKSSQLLKAEKWVAVDAYIFLVPIRRARPIGMCVRNPLAIKISSYFPDYSDFKYISRLEMVDRVVLIFCKLIHKYLPYLCKK